MQTLRRGFTLIEMLVVITIIVILMTLLGAGLMRYLRASREIGVKSFLSSIEGAIEAYESEYGHYPYFHSAAWTDGDLGLVQTQNRHLYRILSGTDGDGNTGSDRNTTNYLDGILSSRSKAVQGEPGQEMIVELYGNPLIYLFDTVANARPTGIGYIGGMRNRFELWSMGDGGEFFNLTHSSVDTSVNKNRTEDDDNLSATDFGRGERVAE